MNAARTTIRIGSAAVNQTALDLIGNRERIENAITAASQNGCDFLCLPELCLTGYGCEDQFLSPGFLKQAWQQAFVLAENVGQLVTSIGLPLMVDETIYNGAAILFGGQIRGVVLKQNLARDGLHYEPRWFRAGKTGWTGMVSDPAGRSVPVGDLVFDIGDHVTLGFEICEDAWVVDRPLERLLDRGVNLIFNPSASHFAFGKNVKRKQLIHDALSRQNIGYVYANLLGNEAGRAIYDGDTYIGWNHQLIDAGARFSYADHSLICADVHFESPLENNSGTAKSTGADDRLETGRISIEWALSKRKPELEMGKEKASEPAGWESSTDIKFEEFSRAVALGLFDYIRKSRSCGVVVSLSGGADSAAVTCLSRLAIEFGLVESGVDWIRSRLSYLGDQLSRSGSEFNLENVCRILICTAYQATRNSSEVTRNAAEAVAQGTGSDHHHLDLDSIVEGYKELVEKAIQRPLDWTRDDITLQNIQARSRSPGIWMFANLRNALLLSTSNRSEAAVGYATMDGDTSGGLAPIAGIDKAFLRTWLRWMESTGPEGLQPFPFLQAVNQQEPTAELRPAESSQTDEGDLMPYPVLDTIERAAVRDKMMPQEIVDQLSTAETGYDREQWIAWVRKFFRLWCRNQWKRERYAPSFHLDDVSLDPKTWCRFPILSGGFENELRNLK